MIRIDDTCWIDDRLITCVEYQLFLDEMRAQGKYHQPDHWPECMFPSSRARQPLLGMRPSDAVAFCEWLTARERQGRLYRLPTPDEAKAYPFESQAFNGLGYWSCLRGSKQDFEFIWISIHRPRFLRLDDLPESDLARALALALDRDIAFDRALALDRALDRAHNIARDLALDRAFALDPDRDIVSDPNRAIALALDCARDLISALDLALTRARDLISALDLALTHARALDLALAHARALDPAPTRLLYTNIFMTWVPLLILQKRIEGTLQPFEGIRIVKERQGIHPKP